MLRKLLSCTAILLLGAAGPALAQGANTNPAGHEAAIQRGAPVVDALNTLEAQGYASFSNLQDMGNGKFSADAVRDGQASHVIIDPVTKQISVSGPARAAPQTMTGGAR